MRERFLPIDRPFDSPPPELNDGGGPEGTAIGIYVTYTQRDDDASIRGSEGSARVENDSPPPELTDGGGPEGTAIRIDVTYAKSLQTIFEET